MFAVWKENGGKTDVVRSGGTLEISLQDGWVDKNNILSFLLLY